MPPLTSAVLSASNITAKRRAVAYGVRQPVAPTVNTGGVIDHNTATWSGPCAVLT